MIVYRLAKRPFHLDLSGKGAELYGGRWNSKGTAMVYTSESRALSFAELSMHTSMGIVPKDYFLVSIRIPDDAAIRSLSLADCPPDWRLNPNSSSTQLIGDAFVRDAGHLALSVPSAVVPGDRNFLINPLHPLIQAVEIVDIEAFEFDSRMGRR